MHNLRKINLSGLSLLALALALCRPTASTANTEIVPQTLSVDQVVDIVLVNNVGLKASHRQVQIASAAIQSAGAMPNPKVEYLSGNNRALLPNLTAGSLSGLAVSQLIENPSLREARSAAANFGLNATQQVVALSSNELAAEARIKTFEHLLRKEEERAAFDALTLLEQIRVRVKVRVDSGEAARYEIIKADAEVINARQKYQTAALQVEQSILALNRLAAGQLPAKWQLKENLNDAIETPSLAETLRSALRNNPELKALQAEMSKREAKLKESKLGRWPGIEIRYAQQRDAEFKQNAIMASIQIPLFDQRTGPIAEANAELARASLQLEGRRIDLEQQINLAWKNLQIARIRVNALSTGAAIEAQAALRVAEAAYRFGERGILDVLDAQRLLRQVNADLLDARFQYQLANIQLHFYAGSDTTRFALKP